MALDPPHPARRAFDHGHGRVGRERSGHEPRRRGRDGVEVAHPHREVDRRRQQCRRRRRRYGHRRAPVLTAATAGHLTAELLRDQLCAVADAEDRYTEAVDLWVEHGRALDVHALRAARQDQRLGSLRRDLGRRHRVRHDLGVHVRLANPPGDQLGILRAEVDHDDGVECGVHQPFLAGRMPARATSWGAGPSRTCLATAAFIS